MFRTDASRARLGQGHGDIADFADGSTHFVSYRISPTIIPALATRNGGEAETVE